MQGALRIPQFGPCTFSWSCPRPAPFTSRCPELGLPAHSGRRIHSPDPIRKPKLSLPPRAPTPGPLVPKPTAPSTKARPARPLAGALGPAAPTDSLAGCTRPGHAPQPHSGELGPPPEPPPLGPPPPLTLALKLADDGVQEGVLRRDVAPPHRHPEPMGGPGGPPPTPARPGPTQASGSPARPWPPHPAARQSTGGAGTGLRAPGLRSAPPLNRGPGLELPELGPPGRPHTCLPAPAEPRAPLRRVLALGSARPSAGLPAPGSRPPRRQPLRRPRLGLRLRLGPAAEGLTRRAPLGLRPPPPGPLPPAARPQRRPLPPHTPRARPSHWLSRAEGSPPPQPLAQPRSPQDSRAPGGGRDL